MSSARLENFAAKSAGGAAAAWSSPCNTGLSHMTAHLVFAYARFQPRHLALRGVPSSGAHCIWASSGTVQYRDACGQQNFVHNSKAAALQILADGMQVDRRGRHAPGFAAEGLQIRCGSRAALQEPSWACRAPWAGWPSRPSAKGRPHSPAAASRTVSCSLTPSRALRRACS